MWGDTSYSFDLKFSNNLWYWLSFYVLWSSVCLLWRKVYLDLLPIFRLCCLLFLILSCINYLDFGDWTPVGCLICKYFSHSIGCLSIFLWFSLLWKVLRLIRSFFLNFVFVFITLDLALIYIQCCVYIFLWKFYSTQSYILVFNLFWIDFFVFGVRKCSNFILLQ